MNTNNVKHLELLSYRNNDFFVLFVVLHCLTTGHSESTIVCVYHCVSGVLFLFFCFAFHSSGKPGPHAC